MNSNTKILFLDCGMGVAGDMLSAALYDLLNEEDKQTFLNLSANLNLKGVEIIPEKVSKTGISGTQLQVLIHGQEEDAGVRTEEHGHEHEHEHMHEHLHQHEHEHMHEHQHEHEHMHEHQHEHEHHHDHGHSHTHGHEHHSMEEIRGIIKGLQVPDIVKADVLAVYESIASAESRVHGMDVNEIHLHEVGMLDAIADITSVCLLMNLLRPDRIIASPIATGYGSVHCAHGILPVPAPATALLLEGSVCFAGEIEGELCTPTGAALVTYFADSYGTVPLMKISGIGYGMGKKEFTKLNAVRVLFGTGFDTEKDQLKTEHEAEETLKGPQDRVVELSANLDDMTGEEIGFAVEGLMVAGALDVWTAPIQMKKNRPGILLTALCSEEKKEEMISLFFRLTSTIGVRETLHRRYVLERNEKKAKTPYGVIRLKESSGYGVSRTKPEYEDLAAIAKQRGLTIREVRDSI